MGNEVPQFFFDQAAIIVKAHEPTNPALIGFELLMMAGLTPKDHGELNKLSYEQGLTPEEVRARFAAFRGKYANDPFALEQIDIYDPDSMYNKMLGEYIRARRRGDPAEKAVLEEWLRQNYPLTYMYYCMR